jgi:hypothetical protein
MGKDRFPDKFFPRIVRRIPRCSGGSKWRAGAVIDRDWDIQKEFDHGPILAS